MRRFVFPVLTCVALICAGVPASAEDPETVAVTRVPFGDSIEVKGTFIPAEAHGIKVDLEVYSGPLEIADDVPLGAVEEGQPLIRFKRKWFERQMEAMRLDVDLARLKFELQEKSFRRQQVSIRLSKLEAKRKYDRAKDDFEFFDQADESMRFAEREQGMQARRDRLENQREELAQLEKMYSSDDLTEETEEIVLKRSRRQLKRAEKSAKFSERRHERWLKKTRGRDREDRALGLERAKLGYEKVMETADAELEQAYLSLKKARIGLRNLDEKLDKLKGDEAQLELRAPVQGLAVPGAWSGSAWPGYAGAKKRLEPGKRVKAGSDLITVLPAGPLHVRTSIEEKVLLQVKPGMAAGVVPIADMSTTHAARVVEVAPVGDKGKYDVTLALGVEDERLFPGMACEITIVLSTGEAALVVPASAVTERDGQTVVFVMGDEGPRQVAIVPGKAKAGLVSVDKGLEEGQRVLLTPPAK